MPYTPVWDTSLLTISASGTPCISKPPKGSLLALAYKNLAPPYTEPFRVHPLPNGMESGFRVWCALVGATEDPALHFMWRVFVYRSRHMHTYTFEHTRGSHRNLRVPDLEGDSCYVVIPTAEGILDTFMRSLRARDSAYTDWCAYYDKAPEDRRNWVRWVSASQAAPSTAVVPRWTARKILEPGIGTVSLPSRFMRMGAFIRDMVTGR